MAKGKKKRRPDPPRDEADQWEAVAEPPSSETAGLSRPPEISRKVHRLRIRKPETAAGQILELVVIIGLALLLALSIQAWLIKPFQIPSGSMEPTLTIGQRILTNRVIYHLHDPSIGDIVVFHPPRGSEKPTADEVVERASVIGDLTCGVQRKPGEPCPHAIEDEEGRYMIKRIVAGPGDKLSVREGHPVVNGIERKDEPYIRPCDEAEQMCNLPRTITIPPDHYFVMGDNRGESFDSRYWGPIPRGWIVGKAFATYWPPSRMGLF
jgi:signal peptidase I